MEGMTLVKAWHGRKPGLGHLCTFECIVSRGPRKLLYVNKPWVLLWGLVLWWVVWWFRSRGFLCKFGCGVERFMV